MEVCHYDGSLEGRGDALVVTRKRELLDELYESEGVCKYMCLFFIY